MSDKPRLTDILRFGNRPPKPRLNTALITSYQGFALLVGLCFVAVLVWPETAPWGLVVFIRGPFLLQATAFLLGILGLQVGEGEYGYGACSPERRVARLAGLVTLGLALALPFLVIQRVEGGLSWSRLALTLGFLLAYGLAWTLAGYAAKTVVKPDGVRFLTKYGLFLLMAFLPTLPNPFLILDALWHGKAVGLWGLALYAGVDIFTSGAWIWTRRRCWRKSGPGFGSATG